MKRILIITLFFVFAFSALCLVSCDCKNDVSMTVGKQTCSGPFCYSSSGEFETLTGCHHQSDCIDCYWFPCAFGCYSNDCTEMKGWEGCAPPSCVVCGFDLTLLECYGDDGAHGTDEETRHVKPAKKGVDYRIDSIKVVVNDDLETLKEFVAGDLNMSEMDDFLMEIVALINLKEATKVDFYVEYTALTELNKVEFGVDIIYKGYDWKNYTNGAYAEAGNIINLGQENLKSQNIPVGKHFLHATVSLNVYELLQFDGFSNIKFVAYAYEEE